MEPDTDRHYIFETFEEAFEAWLIIQSNEELSLDCRACIELPRQTHGGWIFDKESLWQ